MSASTAEDSYRPRHQRDLLGRLPARFWGDDMVSLLVQLRYDKAAVSLCTAKSTC
jgi:hypothetical protein